MSKSDNPIYFHALTDSLLAPAIQGGAVGVLPTDTVYGLVTDAANVQAVTRLYALKRREAKPGTLIAGSVEQLYQLGISRRYVTAVADYWPNPLSVILPVGPDLDYLSQGKGTLAVRIPADETIRQFLETVGPLMTSSANQPGEPTALTVTEAEAYFGQSVDFYVDGGDLAGRAPSTVIRVIDDAIEVVRQGAVVFDENGRIVR